jgi:hypothetical protein
MTPETRAKKDKCTLVVSADGDKLRILGASDDPLIILKGQVCELRAVGKQVHVIQRHAVPGCPHAAGTPMGIPRPTSRRTASSARPGSP